MAHDRAAVDRVVAGRSWLAVTAGVVGVCMDGVYLVVILAQGEADTSLVAAVAALILVCSVLAIVGGLASDLAAPPRLIVLGTATGGLLMLGVVGIFSIGLPLLVAASLCAAGWGVVANTAVPVPKAASWLSLVGGLAAAAVVLVVVAL